MAMAILDIRQEAYENKLAKSYWLSDLIHTLPSALHEVLISDGQKLNMNDIVQSIERRARDNNIDLWVTAVKNSIDYNEEE